jgi:hypothetical protein
MVFFVFLKEIESRFKELLDMVFVDAGPTWFSNNVTTSHGPWPGP